MSELSRPRIAGRHRVSVVLLIGALILSSLLAKDEAESDASFVSAQGSNSMSRRTDESLVAMRMYGWRRRSAARRFAGMKKKSHPENFEERRWFQYKNMHMDMVGYFGHIPDHHRRYKELYPNSKFSFTVKIGFEEGQDELVTEEEVREAFSTEEYAPVAIVVGHHTPHELSKKTYVHFSCNEHATKAMEAMQNGNVGKAENVKLSLVHEKKWIRVRDGVNLVGTQGPRNFWQAAYGDEVYYGWGNGEKLPPKGHRRHPVYPEPKDEVPWKYDRRSRLNLRGTPFDHLNSPWGGWTPRTEMKRDSKTTWGNDDVPPYHEFSRMKKRM